MFKLFPVRPNEVQQKKSIFIKKTKEPRSLFMHTTKLSNKKKPPKNLQVQTKQDARVNIFKERGNDINPRPQPRECNKS